jgi:maleate isomerase
MNMTASVAAPAIGVIVPSSNRVVERVTRAIIEGFPGIDTCFSRVPYSGHPPDGYDEAAFLDAAGMLAQTRPGIIVWNATRGALLCFEPDRKLCALIEQKTGIPATTTALETLALFRLHGITRIALLHQGDVAEGARLETNFAKKGINIIARRDLGIQDNFEAAGVSSAHMACLVGELASGQPDGILIWSTNLAGHTLAETLTIELGIPVLDSAAIGVFSAIDKLGAAGHCQFVKNKMWAHRWCTDRHIDVD